MPKFNSREEYEQWKKDKIKNNLERLQRPEESQEAEKENIDSPLPSLPPQGSQPVATVTELRPIGELFKESWELFKSRFVTLIALYLLSIVFLFVFIGIFIRVASASNDRQGYEGGYGIPSARIRDCSSLQA